jgi:predicted unusual protein kinase regulating ubiquinone biosynthesis (AarF/ABC1/UbiB family)
MNNLLNDESGNASSKRVAGLICIIFLNVTLLANSFSHGDIHPSDVLVQTVGMLAFGCLGLTSLDKYTKNKNQTRK